MSRRHFIFSLIGYPALLLGIILLISCAPAEDSSGPVNPGSPGDDGGGDNTGGGDTDPPPASFWDKYTDVDGDDLVHYTASCTVCHNVRDMDNLYFVRSTITTPGSGDRSVVFTARNGANSFADGNNTFDGVCEVCHTGTTYHRNSAQGDHGHWAGRECVLCHTHELEFFPQAMNDLSHRRHAGGGSGNQLDLACDYCHTSDPTVFQDGQPFAATHVCDECHSPGGIIDGVDDPDVGARTNWAEGIYENDVPKAGKERWCSGCHDLGSSVIYGVSAPPVAGDDTWGFYATGHGRAGTVVCTDCHDATVTHVDGLDQTYSADLDNHQEAFRLSDVDGGRPLLVPRGPADRISPFDDPPYYALCFQCHDRHALLGGPLAPAGDYYSPEMQTNFRNDVPMIIPDGQDTDISVYTVTGVDAANSHVTHLAGPPVFYDSDRDGLGDSYGACTACHNVHGSTAYAMIRDGRLVNHETGLRFSYVRYDRHDPPAGPCPDPIIMTSENVTAAESHGGIMRSTTGANGVCTFCHCSGGNTGEPEYIINCFGVSCVDYYRSYVVPPTPTVGKR